MDFNGFPDAFGGERVAIDAVVEVETVVAVEVEDEEDEDRMAPFLLGATGALSIAFLDAAALASLESKSS